MWPLLRTLASPAMSTMGRSAARGMCAASAFERDASDSARVLQETAPFLPAEGNANLKVQGCLFFLGGGRGGVGGGVRGWGWGVGSGVG